MLPLSPRGHEIRDSGIPQRQLTQAGGSPPVCDVQAVWGLVQLSAGPASWTAGPSRARAHPWHNDSDTALDETQAPCAAPQTRRPGNTHSSVVSTPRRGSYTQSQLLGSSAATQGEDVVG